MTTYTLISGPFDKPNGVVEVIILNRCDQQLYFRVEVVAVKSGSVPPKVGELLTVHQSKLTPKPDWDKWTSGSKSQTSQTSTNPS